jgi:hypothetical protein
MLAMKDVFMSEPTIAVQDLLWELKEMKKCNKSIGSVVQVQEANNGGRARGNRCKQEGRQE